MVGEAILAGDKNLPALPARRPPPVVCSTMTADRLLKIKRGHWAIENQLHWQLDGLFREDDARALIDNAAEVLNILHKLALQLMKQEASPKASMHAKRLRCGYDVFYAIKVLRVNGFS